ncbi:MAG: helix-turn-helix transcriptional regulator [Lachnospiraceae bacterium]|nr:helix-turn-helix transcriptional regulator [Lachnospiraceae bacterium]
MANADCIDDNRKIEISKRIRQCREKSSIKMIEMAGILELGYEQYRRIEHGDVLVKTEHLIAMASIFKVSTDYLLFGTEMGISDQRLYDIINKMTNADRVKLKKALEAIYT